MKKVILLILAIITTLIIYYFTYQKPNHLVFIGDGIALGVNDKIITYNFVDELKSRYPKANFITYLQPNYRVKDLTIEIQKNQKINNIPIQQLIKKSSQTIIFLGTEELIDHLTNHLPIKTINSLITNEYDQLLKELTKYSRKILIIPPYQLLTFDTSLINTQLAELTTKYQVNYLPLINYLPSTNYLSYQDHLFIANNIDSYLIKYQLIDKKT